jgi:hypothetical protein
MFPTRALLARSVWKGKFPNSLLAFETNNTLQVPILSRKSIVNQTQNDPFPATSLTVITIALCTQTNSICDYSFPTARPAPGERMPPIKTQARSATILPNFVGMTFLVHNGKIYHDVVVTEDMVGHKLGEFSP